MRFASCILRNERNEKMTNAVEQVDLYGTKDGIQVHLGKALMPPRMKARELAQEMFGHFEEDDGSDAELCFAAMEQLINWMFKQGFKMPQNDTSSVQQAWEWAGGKQDVKASSNDLEKLLHTLRGVAPETPTRRNGFTCPNCGGYRWGTSGCTGPFDEMIGHCHGDDTHDGCGFRWIRKQDDLKYLYDGE